MQRSLIIICLLVGFAAGLVSVPLLSNAGRYDDMMDKYDLGKDYNQRLNSSSLREMQLNQERELLRRNPC